ncbi:hypothetical protein RN001_009220 [Aquatica leii]|uniref:protein disulfide-isomerase n=1 Tax=Aquatica leii TaxID=1421715 RepID=A0AAN7P4A1_9COLE|nr:hypothetical protein RN001_009220 [Aquatica leii]
MLSLFIIINTLSVILCSNDDIKTGNTILTLNKNSFNAAIKDNEYVFIKFYASWCKHSRELAPLYLKSAKKAFELDLPVKFAEIEASEEQDLCDKYNVVGYPTLILFRRGVAVDYEGERTVEDILMWIKSQLRPAVKELNTLEEAENLINSENLTVVGFYNDLSSSKAKNFVKIAESFDKPVFAVTSNEEIMKKYNSTLYSIVLFEKFGIEKAEFIDDLTLSSMKSFVEIESAPLIHELNTLNAERIFGSNIKNHLVIFVSKKRNNVDHVLNLAKPIAKDYRKKITFLTINSDDERLGQLLMYFNIKPSETPAIALISGKNTVSKYKMKGAISTENIRKFLRDFEENKLKKILLSEQIPENWNKANVYTLVASNFVNVTRDSEKTVVVYFYVIDCKSCPLWDPIVKKLGDYYQNREDVIMCKINAGANEFEEVLFKEVPSIVLFKKNSNKHVLYKGNPNFDDLVNFIESDGNVNKKISVFSSVRCSNNTELREEVLVLDENSIQDVINKNENVFISFYASWCRYSIIAAPQFRKAAKKSLELNLPLTFAQIESTGNKKKFQLDGFPTYKLFRNGIPITYVGNRTSENFIKWLQKHLRSIERINKIEEAEKLIDSEDLLVVGFFKSDQSERAKIYKNVTSRFDNIVFAITLNETIFNAYNLTEETIVIFKKFDEQTVVFTEEFTFNNVINFVETESTPLLQELNKDSVDTVFEELSHAYQYAVILVSKNDSNTTNPVLETARILAKEYKQKIRFIVVDVDKEYLAPILNLFYLSPEDVPSLVLIPDAFFGDSYKISGNLSFKNIKTFLQYFNDSKLDDLLNEKLPDDWNTKPVHTLVKSNFLNVTQDADKNVLVYFYVSNCNSCVDWEKIVEELGKTFESREDTIISKIDVGLNSIDSKWYGRIPAIVLFRQGDNTVVNYTGEINLEDLIQFIETKDVNRTKSNETKLSLAN